MELSLILVLILVLCAEFVNGWTDAPNAIATVVSTRVMTPRTAIVCASIFEFLGTLSGTAVAHTIGTGIVQISAVTPHVIIATMLCIILWSSITVYLGIPTSKSHELVSGLSGAVLATAGPSALVASGWEKVFIGLALSSLIGFTVSFMFSKIVLRTCSQMTPRTAQKVFGKLQIISSMFMAYNHGMNDGQKFIGIFTMTLVVGKFIPSFVVPLWVIILCAFCMALGTSLGGYKIIKTVGMRMVDIKTWQGFTAESSASSVIFFASLFGIPLSTTHTITTSIMGVAAAKNIMSVRWHIVGNIVLAWIVTFPFCATLSFIIMMIIKNIAM